jgi:NAD(P)-dependent dehydrogenase (short-subunit alcohol dehydrogenase family)
MTDPRSATVAGTTAGDGERVALVTGAASGIGRATAARLRTDGVRLVLADVDAEKLRQCLADLGDSDVARMVVTDVRAVADCEKAVAEAIDAFGRLDVLVNSAGVGSDGPSDTMTEQAWDWMLDVNLKGTFFMCRYAIPALERTGGNIVNIASDLGLQGGVEAAIYCASKGGVVNLTKALAVELAARSIRVNAVCPADVDTPMTAAAAELKSHGDPGSYYREALKRFPQRVPRMVRADEVAELVAFLSSDRAEPITGVAMPIDFGVTAGTVRPSRPNAT